MNQNIHLDTPIETPETVQRFACIICEKAGVEEYPDASSYDDESGADLPFAQLAPNGTWVCSRGCLSQLMFQTADPEQQKLLKRFEFALSEIDDVKSRVEPILRAWECHSRLDDHWIADALAAMGHSANRWSLRRQSPLPAWIEGNVDPQDVPRAAIRMALIKLDFGVASRIQVELNFLDHLLAQSPEIGLKFALPYTKANLGKTLEGVTEIDTALKAALAGKAAQ